jgi:hypothetical protein
MTLQDLGNIGEFVAAIGVVVSLIYLAIQVRAGSRQTEENTRALNLSSDFAEEIESAAASRTRSERVR